MKRLNENLWSIANSEHRGFGTSRVTDPTKVKESICDIVQTHVEPAKGDLMHLELKDPKLKFEILRDCTMIIGKRIPNLELNNINTVKDAVDFFIREEQPDQRKGHPVAEWFIKNKDELPPNMIFIPFVKERGVKREDRSKGQKKSRLERQKFSY
ncbi:430_t:CDS:2 [Funneliformis mosseae]|uniref:Large ribosomal subunit protein mL50 n=1 Tax=Funneliformis mosseae TaxID=27381 RepID=A0A9N8WC65_FUNMO|nr:430_t:CDS:2 [Funneliformis mosseae]